MRCGVRCCIISDHHVRSVYLYMYVIGRVAKYRPPKGCNLLYQLRNGLKKVGEALGDVLCVRFIPILFGSPHVTKYKFLCPLKIFILEMDAR